MATQIQYADIKDSCKNLTTLAGNVEDTETGAETTIGTISDSWKGKASDSFREHITTLVENLVDAKRQMALAVVFLASCADAYEEVDKDSLAKLKALIGGQEYIDNYNVDSAPTVDLNSRYGQNEESNISEEETPVDKSSVQSSGCSSSPSGCGSSPSGGCGSGPSRITYSTDSNGTTTAVTTTALVSATETAGTITDLVKTDDLVGKEIKPTEGIKQGPYTVTGYDYWIDSGKAMTWADGTNQSKVAEIWRKQGSVFKNGIAVINVDGVDRYLVAVTTKYGKVGDCIDVVLEDGTVIPCIIGDSKGSDAGHIDGHVLGDGSINVLEFEVQRSKYLQSGNPTTEKWGLPWDSSKDVVSMKNQGSIIGAKMTEKSVAMSGITAEPSTVTEAREAIINVAESQLNNTNEAEYVKMFGESEGTPWCSEFVSWCAAKSGYTAEGIIPKFADAPSGVKWFKENNQFQERSYTPKPGDIIFVGGNEPSHTALVTGVKDGKIQTIDGNKGDKVARSTYDLGSSSIYGFGTPDYSKLVKADSTTTTEETKTVAV